MTWDDLREMKPHRLAEKFRMMDDDEAAGIYNSMKREGYNAAHPITLYEGAVLDGRNRLAIALKLNEEGHLRDPPPCVEYDGDTPMLFVVSENVARRHLSVSDRALLAADMIPDIQKEIQRGRPIKGCQLAPFNEEKDNQAKGRAINRAAQLVGISHGAAARGRRVKMEAPDLVDKVERGEMTITAADNVRKERKDGKSYSKVQAEKKMIADVKPSNGKVEKPASKTKPKKEVDPYVIVWKADGVIRNGLFRVGGDRIDLIHVPLSWLDVERSARLIKQYLTETEMERFINACRSETVQSYPECLPTRAGSEAGGGEVEA